MATTEEQQKPGCVSNIPEAGCALTGAVVAICKSITP